MSRPDDGVSESEALGRSFVASQDGISKHRVELARFGVPAVGLSGVDAITVVYNALEPLVRMADLGEVTVGKIITNQSQSECGLYVDLGPTEGAAVTATAPKYAATEVKLVVARSSPWLRRVMWAVLAIGCIGGIVAFKRLAPDWAPKLQLGVGLLAGCAVAVAMLVVIRRSRLLVGGRSEEVTAQLNEIVHAWVDSDPANAPRKKRRKKKRRKRRKKAASPDDEV